MKRELSKYLKELNKKELEQEIKKLFDKFKDVKDFYAIELSNDTSAILNEYKARIEKEYFPKRGYGEARSSVARKVISDFRKISIFKTDLIDLILFRVEIMLKYTLAYGDIDEPFYLTLENSFEQACKLIQKEQLQDQYKDLCMTLAKQSERFGWGTYREMAYIYKTYIMKK